MRQFLEQSWMDARVGARSLLRDRSFTIVAALTLSIGIALNAAMFSVVSAVLLRPPPYVNPDQIVVIDNRPPNAQITLVSPAEFFDYRRLSQTTTQIAQIQGFNANVTGGDRPDRVDAVAVSPSFFTLLGTPPLRGRTFVAADEQPGFTQIAVISYGVWQRVFGGAESAIGHKVRLDDDDYTIVGVMPRNFKHPIDRPGAPVEIWLPAGFHGAPWPTTPPRAGRSGDVIARMKPGTTVADVQRDFDRINNELLATYPTEYGATGSAWRIVVRPLHDVMVGDNGRPLALLLGAVGFVFLVACTNVASLLLARGAARRTETAVRAAIGAGRGRLVRSLLIEHALLALAGGVTGVLLTAASVGVVRALAPAGLPSRDEISIDWRVLVFVMVCSVIAGLLIGVLPAFIGARTPLSDVLRAGGRSATASSGSRRARSVLVVLELAMSVVLLAGAGLVVRSFWKLQDVDLGFTPDHLLTAEITVSLPNDRTLGKYVAAAPRAQFFEDILNRLKALPGVQRVAGASGVPLRDLNFEGPVTIEGHPELPPTQLPRATTQPVSGDYFATMGTKILRGHGVSDQDRLGMPINIVISETAARRLFPNEDPLGKRMKRGPLGGPAPWMTIVGIAQDAKLRSADGDPGNVTYVSMQQIPPITLAVLVRSGQDPATLAPQIATVVHAVDPDQPVYRVQTMESVVEAAVGQRRFAAWLFVAFAVLSLALAAVGVYGLIAQSVAYRQREIGLRMALGADPGSVLRLIVGDALSLATIGVVLGLVLSLILTRLLESQLFGVSPRDPVVLGAIVLVLLIVACAASYLPGRAASRLNPVSALRAD
jgi:putative ABC transport system permease protein